MVKNEKEGLYGEAESTKAQNIRFIVTTALVALVVLGIAVWGIIYAVGGNRGDKGENKPAETAQTEKTEEKTTVEAASGENTSSNVVEVTDLKDEKSAKSETTAAVATTTTENENIPKTGPEGIIPIALLLGAITTFAGSVKLAKFKA